MTERWIDAEKSDSRGSRSGLCRRELKILILVFLLSRTLLVGAGLLGKMLLPPGKAVVGSSLRVDVGRRGTARILENGEAPALPAFLQIWARWDSHWYLAISAAGYDPGGLGESLDPQYQPGDSSGFFPLYPFLIRWLRPLLGGVAAGVLLSNIFLLLSLLFLLELSVEIWGKDEGRKIGLGAGLALLLWPLTLFHSAVYSESLFLCLSLGAVLCVLRKRDVGVVASAALATLTRPFALILVFPLLMFWWPERRKRLLGWFVLPTMLLTVAMYMLFSYGLFGDALAFVHRQSHWRGASIFPGYALVRWFMEGPTIHGGATSTIEALTALILLALLPMAFRRLPTSLALYLAFGLALPLSSTLWSFGRISSDLFPLYLLLGLIWAGGRPWSRMVFGFSALFSLLAMFFFGAGWWVG